MDEVDACELPVIFCIGAVVVEVVIMVGSMGVGVVVLFVSDWMVLLTVGSVISSGITVVILIVSIGPGVEFSFVAERTVSVIVGSGVSSAVVLVIVMFFDWLIVIFSKPGVATRSVLFAD